MVMVGVATFIAGKFIFKDGFSNAGWRWGRPVHCITVLLFALLVWFVPVIIESYLGLNKPIGKIMKVNILLLFLLNFIATLIPGFGEEFGWRGYMLPRLAAKYGAKKGLLIHAFIWWCWHLPVVIGMGLKGNDVSENPFMNVVMLLFITLIPTILHAVIFAFIWGKTKSLAVASVYHSAFDEVRDTLDKTVGFGSLVNIWQMAVIIITGGILLWKVNWDKLLRP
jgi:membrane protease YdiL (CAAX protease family)